ncbi:hypothetical protein [Methylibium petroleiphilum]|uniref:hypothetical protein n=1 Tax=Methylibium petroleiphilum TaxID=105560 RepID=UPI00003CD59E|nr:hypothetical protein [Methylibium petroleiphilum]
MSIELIKSQHVDEPLPTRVTDYKLVNKQAGRGGTWLTLNLRVTTSLRIERVVAEITDMQPEVEADDAEQALDKLAEWMERAAAELRARGKPAVGVAIYPNGNP